MELDAGWNIPREWGYGLNNDGDYDFDTGRFPDPKGMIDAIHAAGQRVILHVAPLVMGKPTEAFPRGNQPVYDTTLGWRFVNRRMDQLHGTLAGRDR